MAKEDNKKIEDKKIKDSPEKTSEKIEPSEKAGIDTPDTAVKIENDDIKNLKEQLAAEKDRLLRLSAEFENY